MSNPDEGMLLGAGGSLKSTFEAVKTAGRQVSIWLLTGDPPGRDVTGREALSNRIKGNVLGHPTDQYVVIHENPESKTTISRVLVQYAAIAAVGLVPNVRLLEMGDFNARFEERKGRVLWVVLASTIPRGRIICGRLEKLNQDSITLVGDQESVSLKTPDVPIFQQADIDLSLVAAGGNQVLERATIAQVYLQL
jgi:hypothetical protein